MVLVIFYQWFAHHERLNVLQHTNLVHNLQERSFQSPGKYGVEVKGSHYAFKKRIEGACDVSRKSAQRICGK